MHPDHEVNGGREQTPREKLERFAQEMTDLSQHARNEALMRGGEAEALHAQANAAEQAAESASQWLNLPKATEQQPSPVVMTR